MPWTWKPHWLIAEVARTFETLRKNPLLVLYQAARDLLDTLAAPQDNFHSGIESTNTIGYIANSGWEPALHRTSGEVIRVCGGGFCPLWSTVVETLRAQGMAAGPSASTKWNDGDAGFVRVIWCLIRHLRPVNGVETGVAHGITSRFILEALETMGAGRLWSIDLPPLNPTTRQEAGVAVLQTGVPADRWTYIAGTSRRRPLALLSRLGRIDLFNHDSMPSYRNVMFELECAWRYLSAGGVIVVDDIDVDPAFDTFSGCLQPCRRSQFLMPSGTRGYYIGNQTSIILRCDPTGVGIFLILHRYPESAKDLPIIRASL
jgi:predicted O-methyltransferase YrrM